MIISYVSYHDESRVNFLSFENRLNDSRCVRWRIWKFSIL